MKNAFVPLLAASALLSGAAETGANPALRSLGNAFADVYEKVAPSVVVLEVARRPGAGDDEAGWNLFFRDRGMRGEPPVEESEGSGFIIREDGYILTNAHVIEGADPRGGIIARRQDGTRLPLTIVGIDEKTDLAVLKAEATGLPAVKWGDSDKVRVGEFVCGIGAPFELDYTLTAGIISAKGRSNLTSTVYEDYLQTDTAINPGNSGGPLCDLDGRVIGVNTLINGLSRGLSFAIPSNIAREVSEELIANGRVLRPWLGIRIETLSDDPALQEMMGLAQGVLVRTIEPDAPAARSTLRPSDVIVAIDGKKVATARDLQQAVLRKKVGDTVELQVRRRGAEEGNFETVKVTTEELPTRPSLAGAAWQRSRPDASAADDGAAGSGSPWGFEAGDLSPEVSAALGVASGAIVLHVEPDGPAERADLQRRDVITAVGQTAVADAAALRAAMELIPEGEAAMLLVERDGKKTYAILKR